MATSYFLIELNDSPSFCRRFEAAVPSEDKTFSLRKEKVLSSLGTAASNLRQKLGESLSSIKKYDVAIEQATTSSLEALKAYAMGNEARASGRNRESLKF